MDSKERVSAANALVEWFNSQEIASDDAKHVMAKVIAKIVVGSLRGPHTPTIRRQLDDAVDRYTLQLIHEINDRLFHVRR